MAIVYNRGRYAFVKRVCDDSAERNTAFFKRKRRFAFSCVVLNSLRSLFVYYFMYIETEYVWNNWVSSCFIGGPHGWCHPDGTIGYSTNVGKWPEVSDVYDDWTKLAEAFPFLEVEATLMSGEDCEIFTEPVVSMLIRNGTVELIDPKERNIHKEFDRPSPVQAGTMSLFSILCRLNAHPISLEQIRKWADQIFKE